MALRSGTWRLTVRLDNHLPWVRDLSIARRAASQVRPSPQPSLLAAWSLPEDAPPARDVLLAFIDDDPIPDIVTVGGEGLAAWSGLSGRRLWQLDPPLGRHLSPLNNAIAYASLPGTEDAPFLVFGDRSGRLYACDLATGRARPDVLPAGGVFHPGSSYHINEGMQPGEVLAANLDGRILHLALPGGRVVETWSAGATCSPIRQPSIPGQRFPVALAFREESPQAILGFEPGRPEPAWEVPSPSANLGLLAEHPTLGTLAIFGSDKGGLLAVDAAGTVAWRLSFTSASTTINLWPGRDGRPERLLVALGSGRVQARDLDGGLLWESGVEGEPRDILATDLDGDGTEEIAVLNESPDGLWVLSGEDGHLLWKAALNGTPWNSLAIADTNADGAEELICIGGRRIEVHGSLAGFLWAGRAQAAGFEPPPRNGLIAGNPGFRRLALEDGAELGRVDGVRAAGSHFKAGRRAVIERLGVSGQLVLQDNDALFVDTAGLRVLWSAPFPGAAWNGGGVSLEGGADGPLVLAAGHDGILRAWSARDGRPAWTWTAPGYLGAGLAEAALPNGSSGLLVGCGDGAIRLLDDGGRVLAEHTGENAFRLAPVRIQGDGGPAWVFLEAAGHVLAVSLVSGPDGRPRFLERWRDAAPPGGTGRSGIGVIEGPAGAGSAPRLLVQREAQTQEGSMTQVACLDGATGARLWTRDLPGLAGTENIPPVPTGDLDGDGHGDAVVCAVQGGLGAGILLSGVDGRVLGSLTLGRAPTQSVDARPIARTDVPGNSAGGGIFLAATDNDRALRVLRLPDGSRAGTPPATWAGGHRAPGRRAILDARRFVKNGPGRGAVTAKVEVEQDPWPGPPEPVFLDFRFGRLHTNAQDLGGPIQNPAIGAEGLMFRDPNDPGHRVALVLPEGFPSRAEIHVLAVPRSIASFHGWAQLRPAVNGRSAGRAQALRGPGNQDALRVRAIVWEDVQLEPGPDGRTVVSIEMAGGWVRFDLQRIELRP